MRQGKAKESLTVCVPMKLKLRYNIVTRWLDVSVSPCINYYRNKNIVPAHFIELCNITATCFIRFTSIRSIKVNQGKGYGVKPNWWSSAFRQYLTPILFYIARAVN